jgi:hypothetical protein
MSCRGLQPGEAPRSYTTPEMASVWEFRARPDKARRASERRRNSCIPSIREELSGSMGIKDFQNSAEARELGRIVIDRADSRLAFSFPFVNTTRLLSSRRKLEKASAIPRAAPAVIIQP